MGVILKNNTSSLLVGSVSAGATSVVVTTGAGAGFPSPGASDYFYATLISPTGLYEIVKCTARVNDVLTIVRAQEGTVAIPFPDGSRIELRITAKSVRDLVEEYNEASEISFVPTGPISATNVQDAIVEITNEPGDAVQIGITDAGGYYTGTNVEAALQELRAVSLNTFTGDGTTVAYTITATYGLENLTSVHINGVYQHKATYSLSGTTLTFSQAPPLNTIIEVLVR
jgi:hypothetical protein